MRLAGIDEIHLELRDSRKFLEGLRSILPSGKTLFFYLDAHWYDDLPLKKEIDLIASFWKEYVIMVDDFQVPDDDGYYFDNYGRGNSLDLNLLGESIKQYNLEVFFPTAHSTEEPVGKCGCVVLAPHGEFSQKLLQTQSLRHWRGIASDFLRAGTTRRAGIGLVPVDSQGPVFLRSRGQCVTS